MNQGTKIVAVVLFVLFVGTAVYYVTLSPSKPSAPTATKALEPAARPAAADPGSITMNPPAGTATTVAPVAPRISDPLASATRPATGSPAPTPAPAGGATLSGPATLTNPPASRVALGPGGTPTSVMPPLTVSRPNTGTTAASGVSGGTAPGIPAVRPTAPASLTAAPPVAEAPGTSNPASSTAAREHVVASGETLSSIAARYLGSESRWEEIAKANPGVNPKSMRVGNKLSIPAGGSATPKATASVAAPATPSSAANEYVVKAGDTLTGIARQTLGSADWESIYEANRSLIGPNPAALKVGMKLAIPKRS